jgi:hypothetical protein
LVVQSNESSDPVVYLLDLVGNGVLAVSNVGQPVVHRLQVVF